MKPLSPKFLLPAFTISMVQAQQQLNPAGPKVGTLAVPGATLTYETVGTGGQLLLFISGANGDADIWRPISRVLASSSSQHNLTVAAYDRRGFSRSMLSTTEAQDYANRLSTDADDARRLIEHLSPGQTAYVLGTSSGAIVALQLLTLYPEVLKVLISHEAPLITVLEDQAELEVGQKAIYDAWRAGGAPPAFAAFMQLYAPGSNSSGADDSGLSGLLGLQAKPGNLMYWFERELLPYPLHEFDLEAMAKSGDKLALANGDGTDPSALHLRANVALGEKFGIKIEAFPGGHVEYAIDPEAFAAVLLDVLAKKVGGDL